MKTNKSKSQNFIIPLVVYPFDIMVSIGETDEQLKKRFKRYNIDYSDYFEHELSRGRSTLFTSGQTVIRFRTTNDTDCSIVSHEIFHAVTVLLNEIGMPFSLEHNDEAYAYLIGYVTEQFYKQLNQ